MFEYRKLLTYFGVVFYYLNITTCSSHVQQYIRHECSLSELSSASMIFYLRNVFS